MIELKTYEFDKDIQSKINSMNYDSKWPMVYIIEGEQEAYIGETANAATRTYQHLQNPNRKKLKKITFLTNKKFNKSVALDLESFLIRYISADGKYLLQNGNAGLQNHVYYEKEEYRKEFDKLWEKLREAKIVQDKLEKVVISNLYRFSPYKVLTNDQNIIITDVLNSLIKDIKNNKLSTTLITGEAGTGKSVVAIYLMKLLVDIDRGIIPYDFDIDNLSSLSKLKGENKKINIGLVTPTQALRKTYKEVFKQIPGLSANMVLTPSDATKKDYDILIVDETMRLRQRRGLSQDGYATFNRVNLKNGWDKNTTEFEWIINKSKYQIMFYFESQTVRPADINKFIIENALKNRLVHEHKLFEQLRCLSGNDYIKYTRDLLSNKKIKNKLSFNNYDFKIVDDIEELEKLIKTKNKECGLSRIVAGFAWKWVTKSKTLEEIKNKNLYDIKIDNKKFIWNSTDVDWVYSENAINEVGCIHTILGYDLNYTGIIIGPDLKYENNKIIIDKKNYFDIKGKVEIKDDQELFEYITNVYHILFTRGIKGTYIYVCDENLRNHLKKYIDLYK